jgi:hypothetical protein
MNITQSFLQFKQKKANDLIVHKLRVSVSKWLNLLTKWDIVVKCGNILYIFALYK